MNFQTQSEPQPPRSVWTFIGSILLTDLGIHALSSYVATNVFHAPLHLETAFQGDSLAQVAQAAIFIASLFPGTIVGGLFQQFILHPIYGRRHDSWSSETESMANDLQADFGNLADSHRVAASLEAAHTAAENQRVQFQHQLHFGRAPVNYNSDSEN